ncbi:MAG: hypothetical protein IT280_07015 [Ignavibacteria bacterium]|nr:hypothetical protein [Ignavibacteria bacterium]
MQETKNYSAFLLVLLFMFLSTSVFSQSEKNKTPEERAKLRTERLTDKLSLSETQKQQVYDVILNHANQVNTIRNTQDITKESRREQMKTLRTDTNQKLEGIFSKEQIDKWNTMKQKMKEKHKNKHGNKKHGKKNKGKIKK